MSAMPVSVVIPVWNCEAYVGEAVASVLEQRHPVETLLVDDGCTDGSVEAALRAAPTLTVVRRDNGGIGAARNSGIRRASGELLAFLDSDDRWTAGKLTRQIALLEARPELDMVFGQVRQFYSPELGMAQQGPPVAERSSGQICGAMLIRTASFHRVGWFAEDVKVGEFIDWYARAMSAGLRHETLPEIVLERRIHGRNTGTRERDARSDYARVLKAALDRRRAADRSAGDAGA
jgi:glycosyltransferase involved in cell wall biosynthesis